MTIEQLLHYYDQASRWPAASGLDVSVACPRTPAPRQLRIHRGGPALATARCMPCSTFLQEMRNCPGAPELQPGDVVTTGT